MSTINGSKETNDFREDSLLNMSYPSNSSVGMGLAPIRFPEKTAPEPEHAP